MPTAFGWCRSCRQRRDRRERGSGGRGTEQAASAQPAALVPHVAPLVRY
jgi:hypothetical protein